MLVVKFVQCWQPRTKIREKLHKCKRNYFKIYKAGNKTEEINLHLQLCFFNDIKVMKNLSVKSCKSHKAMNFCTLKINHGNVKELFKRPGFASNWPNTVSCL